MPHFGQELFLASRASGGARSREYQVAQSVVFVPARGEQPQANVRVCQNTSERLIDLVCNGSGQCPQGGRPADVGQGRALRS